MLCNPIRPNAVFTKRLAVLIAFAEQKHVFRCGELHGRSDMEWSCSNRKKRHLTTFSVRILVCGLKNESTYAISDIVSDTFVSVR